MEMAKRFTVTATLFMAMICLFWISGCSSPDDKFIGTWYDRQHNVALEIRKDNRCIKSIPGYSDVASWKLLDEKKIQIIYGHQGVTQTEDATLTGNSLNFEGLVMTR